MTRVRVEPRSFDQSRRKNDAFTHSATLGHVLAYILRVVKLGLTSPKQKCAYAKNKEQ